jgi:myo-inositol catabolism protein IolC
MTMGYDKPLYILPFDHRRSYGSEIFGFKDPLSPAQIAEVAASKQVIYDGFRQAVAAGAPRDRTGILVDEEFGSAVLRDAVKSGFITCMPNEKSGQHEFDFEYGEDFEKHLDQFKPTFAKVLVRYNPEGDKAMNARQNARLKRLGDACRRAGRHFMFELLVPAEPAQLQRVGGDKHAYDVEVRPGLMVKAIGEIQDAGVDPDVWKIEGLDRREDCAHIVEVARRGGRTKVGCIVLGRGEQEQKVVGWLQTAAGVPGFTGFAVGRSTFLEPIKSLRAGKMTAAAASTEIARRFREWIRIFEEARGSTKR